MARTITLGGLRFAGGEIPGVQFTGQKLSGWLESTDSTAQLQQKPRAGGAWLANTAQRAARTISFETLIEAETGEQCRAAVDRINAEAKLVDATFRVDYDGISRWTPVFQQAKPVITDYPTDRVKKIVLQLGSTEFRKFGDELSTSTGLPSSTGGLTIPFTVPFTIAATQVSGQCSLTNPGNATGPVRLRINGPVTGPIVTHVGTGIALVFSSSITLAAGEWLDVDMENQLVLAQGQASRSGWVIEDGWSGFDPGDNEWAFSAVSYNADALLQVFATPAWL